ncbi:hypothetical protein [Streptomyces sp. NBC_00576]|uniref:hypothetical protein n=1 Tax=Streptomyces sp. NBC_00576 TaxID=2903665 RepID=UPI002E811199|nr:hypothetical protein [Streptomyces sp. NBC_00576]WUB72184.1 hypothetical protein OG734_19860 [Streptomyces sp. NBC_00576]
MRNDTFKGTRRILATAVTAVGLLAAFAGSAHASGGTFSGRTENGCGTASGTYHWYETTMYNGKQAFKTDWDMSVVDHCSTDNVSESLYTKYSKWNGSSWANDNKFHKIAASGNGTNVADVRLYICHVGDGNSCVEL